MNKKCILNVNISKKHLRSVLGTLLTCKYFMKFKELLNSNLFNELAKKTNFCLFIVYILTDILTKI